MKAPALLQKLASKVGVTLTEKEFENFITGGIDLPDADTNKLLSGLLTLDDARQNHDLKKHFASQVLDGADAELNRLMDEMGFEITDREEMKALDTTYKRISAIGKKIANLEKKKAGASAGDKKELQDQINSLTSKIADLQKSHSEEIKTIRAESEAKLTNSTIRSIFASKKFANTQIPVDVNIETSMVLLNRELERKGAKIINTPIGLKLVQAKDESLDWLNSANEKPSFEAFVDGFLAENKLLDVNGANPTNPAPGNGLGNFVPTVIPGGGNGQNVNQELVNAFNESRQQLDASLKY